MTISCSSGSRPVWSSSAPRIKSIRAGTVNLKDSFCTVKNGELFAYGIHISPYEHGSIYNRDPDRPKRPCSCTGGRSRSSTPAPSRKVLTLVPLSLYFKDSRVKVELGLCKGKKLYDKRDADAQRSAKREIDRTIKEKNY